MVFPISMSRRSSLRREFGNKEEKVAMSPVVRIARVIQIIMGLVLVVAGGAKAWDPVLFYWETMPFAQMLGMAYEKWPTVGRLAQFFSPLEFGLGAALILNWRPRIVFPAATILMALFTGLTARGWYMGITANCGCFGALVDRSPAQATIEDAIMLVALVFAWLGTRPLQTAAAEVAAQRQRWVVGATVLAIVVTGARFVPEMDRLEGSDLQEGQDLGQLEISGIDLNLQRGDHLVEFFSPRCQHCRNAVPKLNDWTAMSGLPPIVALHHFGNDSPAIAEFRQSLGPRFQIGSISFVDFRRLTYKSGYPRLAFVRDGAIKAVWDKMPTAEQIKNMADW